MPAICPPASNTVKGSIEPLVCRPSRRSISLAISSGFGIAVYHSFHRSPSLTASVSPETGAGDNGSSRACGPTSVTGSGQGIFSPFLTSHSGAIRSIEPGMTLDTMTAKSPSLVQKIQRQTGRRPVHRHKFALPGQRDLGRFQFGPAKGNVGGDAITGRHLFDQRTIRRDHRNAARDQRRNADIAARLDRERIEHLIAAEPRDRLASLAAIDHLARFYRAGLRNVIGPQSRGRRLGDVDGLLVGRQPDAVRGQDAVHALDALLHAGLEIIEGADIHVAGPAFAKIREPQAAMLVENQIVWSA